MVPSLRHFERLRAEIARWPKPAVLTVVLTAFWACELFTVQELTLSPMHWQSLRSVITYRVVRFVLDALLCAALVSSLPRVALLLLFLSNPFFYVGVIVYHDYFHQPLSLQVVLNQSSEGLTVADALLPLFEPWHALFIVSLAVKLGLLFARKRPQAAWPVRRRPSMALLSSYVVTLALMNPLLQPLYKIGTWDSVSGLGSIYGYLPVWTAELAFVDAGAMRDRALARAESGKEAFDRLANQETSFPIRDRLVFLQVESFDYALIGFSVKGRPVTPHMNDLWDRSLAYCVQAAKGTGSSDADFKALMGHLPSADIPTYKIPGYPYEGSFVRRLRRLGFHTAAIHGVTGEFFNRRPAYEQMGFDELVFREEFERMRSTPLTAWTLPDDELLDYTAKKLASPGRQFDMVITATSHIPFPMDRARKVFFPDEDDANFAYFDSIHFVDDVIGRFVRALPAETTAVIYGDHSSQVDNPAINYRQVSRGDVGCVPFMVFDTGENLRPTQRTGPLARSCDMTLLEALRFVHRKVEAGASKTAEAPR